MSPRNLSLLILAASSIHCTLWAQERLSTTVQELRQQRHQEEAWFATGRKHKTPTAPNRVPLRFSKAMLAQAPITALDNESYIGTQWSPLGPSPVVPVLSGGDQDYGSIAGRVTAIAVDQGDASGNTVFIGAATGGVWKSTNAASSDAERVTWQPLTDNQPTLAVGSVALQPANSNLLLVGTGEPNSSVDSYYGLGILRSTDGGSHWTLIDTSDNGAHPFHGLAFAKIAFSSDNPNLVVAATASASEGLPVGAEQPNYAAVRGLYYSTDAGASWHLATVLDSAGLSPSATSATSVIYNAAAHMFYASLRFHGFYKSADGINWSRLANQPPSVTFDLSLSNCPSQPSALPNNCPLYRAEITQVPGRNEMYVWYVDANDVPTNEGIYLTRDGGITWTSLNVSGISSCGDPAGCDAEDGTYALALTAVPNGSTATDIYAGSTNIYKCRLNSTSNPTCSAANNGFVNLTHAFGCNPVGSYSDVYPLQHAMGFSTQNPLVIYFANDGGLYRTTNSFTTGVTGQCGTTSFPFDNLNGNLGSLIQFISLSQAANDSSAFLGSATGSGLLATSSSGSGANGLTWTAVGSGLGLTAIADSQWFSAAGMGFGILRCVDGIACTPSDWQYVIIPNDVANDGAAFRFPFIVDPQNPLQLIVGTCRMWRGPDSGSWTSANQLSGKFDGSSGTASCADDSGAFVRSIAAGGPTSGIGSEVIYAGTEDGKIWVTTAASSGPTSWHDVSPVSGGFQDPACGTSSDCPYTISAIAIDASDATGNTAYVAVLGFGVGHVWLTRNAGGSWSDISGNLPDLPANALAFDKSAGSIYVGTDVGVFAAQPNGSSTNWSRVGPSTGAGALPNAPVMNVLISNSGNEPARLTTALYGRGAWEMPLPDNLFPDFALQVTNPSLTTYPGLAVSFHGVVTSVNGYSKPVSFRCYAGGGTVPEQCGNSSTFTPNSDGTAFTQPASDARVADYSFRLQALDGTGLVHETPVQMSVVDFSADAPDPPTISVVPGSSTTVNVQVRSLGSFADIVVISCPSAPASITCNGNSSRFTAGSGQTIPVTVAVSSNAAPGTYTIALSVESNDGLRSKTASLAVEVVPSTPDFFLQSSAQMLSAVKRGQTASAIVTVAARNGFSGTVNLVCSSSALPAGCSVRPATVNIFPQDVTVWMDTSEAAPGNANVSVMASAQSNLMHSLPFTLPVVTFGLGAVNAPGSTSPGQVAKFSVELVSKSGYAGSIQTTCDASSISKTQTCTLSSSTPSLVPNGRVTIEGQIAIPAGQALGDYNIQFSATDTSYAGLTVTQNLKLHVTGTPAFTIAASQSSATINAGLTTSDVTLTLTPVNGFAGSVNLSCASLPALSACTFKPESVDLNGESKTVVLNISTTAVTVATIRRQHKELLALLIGFGMPFCLLQTASSRRTIRKSSRGALIVCGPVILALLLSLTSCGGSSGSVATPTQPKPGTPSGTFNVVISGTSGTEIETVNFKLIVN